MNVNKILVVSSQFHMPSVKFCFKLIYGDKYHIEYVASLDRSLGKKELATWTERVQRMVNEAYPILFQNVSHGDLKAISIVINEANSQKPSCSRLAFEKVLADIAGLKKGHELKGVI